MSYAIQQSTSAYKLMFLMVQSADHITALTGASPTVTLSKNGAAFGSPSGAVSELANGWYLVAGNATDSNTLGPLALHATAASGDPTDALYEVVIRDLTTATIALVTNLTNAPTNGDLTATMKTSVTTAATAATPTAAAVAAAVNITGDLSATMKTSVTTAATAATPVAASVTGAVGSVAGNVGGNVGGSVASVTATVNADVKKVNGVTVIGAGTSGDLWRA